MLLILLSACDPGDDTGKGDEVVYAEPALAMMLSTSPGYLRSTCSFGVDLKDGNSGETLWSAEAAGQGQEWVATTIELGRLYVATAWWDYCSDYDEGTGTYDSTSFSANDGDLFVFHYDGLDTAFETLAQEVDYYGGKLDVELVSGADGAALASAAGVSGAEGEETDHWDFTWSDDTNVAEVLSTLTIDDNYLSGTPLWVRDQPSWW